MKEFKDLLKRHIVKDLEGIGLNDKKVVADTNTNDKINKNATSE
jgi:hypothetical protein